MNNLSQNPEINISNAIVFSKNPTALEIVQHPHEISSNNYSYILNNQLNCLEYKNKTYSNEKNVKLQKFVNNKNISKMHYFNKIMTNRNSLPNMINMIASKGQQNKESNRNSSPKLSLRNEEEIEEEERFCKICFEQTSNELTSRLIAPCKCSGSVKYIHEECLKTWLVSQNIDLKYANCELCQTSYKMNIEIGSKCLPSSILNMYNLMFLFCLSIFLTCFIVIIIRSALKW